MTDPTPNRRSIWLPILAIGLALTAAVLLAIWLFPALFGVEIGPRMVYLVILLGALIVAFRGSRIGAGRALRFALLWIVIGAALFLAYDLWTDPPDWLAGAGTP
ncbi:MAG: hypothetical protein HOH66_13595 [Rhodospirillaceae bacterium]|jgi:hypothetical protein|nr:hypothetical protein [Rhodospirillaceae bacterium]MBT6118894.1 hypothetical protein [Rhodospirillaceae bacterium]